MDYWLLMEKKTYLKILGKSLMLLVGGRIFVADKKVKLKFGELKWE